MYSRHVIKNKMRKADFFFTTLISLTVSRAR